MSQQGCSFRDGNSRGLQRTISNSLLRLENEYMLSQRNRSSCQYLHFYGCCALTKYIAGMLGSQGLISL